jgi:hypothetical protein
MGFGVRGPQRDGRLIVRNRFLVAAERRQRAAEIVARLRVVRVDGQCPLVMHQRLFGACEALQRVAEVAVRLGKAGPERERLLVAADGVVVAFQSGQRHRQMKLCIG